MCPVALKVLISGLKGMLTFCYRELGETCPLVYLQADSHSSGTSPDLTSGIWETNHPKRKQKSSCMILKHTSYTLRMIRTDINKTKGEKINTNQTSKLRWCHATLGLNSVPSILKGF